MLVSKIKPCMSKYKPLVGETANGSINQLWFLRSFHPTWITVVILELIHALKPRLSGLGPGRRGAFIRSKPIEALSRRRGLGPFVGASFRLVTLNNFSLIARPRAGDASFKCLPYQLSMVGYAPTMVATGNGESGFDSGEGA